METTRHFTASVYIVHDGKVLLHLHKRLQIWIPVGGHIDRDELPQEAAVREAREESGLEVELYRVPRPLDLDDEVVQELVCPQHFMLQTIQPGHQHIDSVFFATSKIDRIIPETGNFDHYRWLSAADLDGLPLRREVRLNALAALQLLV